MGGEFFLIFDRDSPLHPHVQIFVFIIASSRVNRKWILLLFAFCKSLSSMQVPKKDSYLAFQFLSLSFSPSYFNTFMGILHSMHRVRNAQAFQSAFFYVPWRQRRRPSYGSSVHSLNALLLSFCLGCLHGRFHIIPRLLLHTGALVQCPVMLHGGCCGCLFVKYLDEMRKWGAFIHYHALLFTRPLLCLVVLVLILVTDTDTFASICT
jgi:hypothetical protein